VVVIRPEVLDIGATEDDKARDTLVNRADGRVARADARWLPGTRSLDERDGVDQAACRINHALRCGPGAGRRPRPHDVRYPALKEGGERSR
jgi:hypothetical protein